MDCIATYVQCSMDLLDPDVRAQLFTRERPIYTKTRDDMPTKYGLGSLVKNSVIADGCFIEGSVENCVLFRGVHVQKLSLIHILSHYCFFFTKVVLELLRPISEKQQKSLAIYFATW